MAGTALTRSTGRGRGQPDGGGQDRSRLRGKGDDSCPALGNARSTIHAAGEAFLALGWPPSKHPLRRQASCGVRARHYRGRRRPRASRPIGEQHHTGAASTPSKAAAATTASSGDAPTSEGRRRSRLNTGGRAPTTAGGFGVDVFDYKAQPSGGGLPPTPSRTSDGEATRSTRRRRRRPASLRRKRRVQRRRRPQVRVVAARGGQLVQVDVNGDAVRT